MSPVYLRFEATIIVIRSEYLSCIRVEHSVAPVREVFNLSYEGGSVLLACGDANGRVLVKDD